MSPKPEQIRIGVFVCHCGKNIAAFLDTADVARYAATLPGVVYTVENHYSCSEPGVKQITEAITAENLNRVIVAACTPRTHEPTFRTACTVAGLNPFLFEFVNIREHCSWVHMKERDEATRKARDLIRMGVAKVARLEPQQVTTIPVIQRAMVVGGGLAGMSAALNIADRGYEVDLVERRDRLGGKLAELQGLSPDDTDPRKLVKGLETRVRGNPKINVYTSSQVKEIRGYIGTFSSIVDTPEGERTSESGVILIATGSPMLDPAGHYGYDGERVITQLELEGRLKHADFKPGNTVMIQCVGARNKDNPHCGKICCMTSFKNAMQLKKLNPDGEVIILYRDLQAYGTRNEAYLQTARGMNIRFARYNPEAPPVVDGRSVTFHHELLNKDIEVPADLVVLSTPMVPGTEARELSKLLRVPVGDHGFLLEAHAQLRPVEFAMDGIYLCGSVHWPCDVPETISKALAAASRASIPLVNGTVEVDPITCYVEFPELCRGCGVCEELCQYKAPAVEVTNGVGIARINEAVCKGCGTCAAFCPTGAIGARHFKDDQIVSMMEALLGVA